MDVALPLHALGDDVDRQRRRVEVLAHLLPVQRRRDGGPLARAHRVRGVFVDTKMPRRCASDRSVVSSPPEPRTSAPAGS